MSKRTSTAQMVIPHAHELPWFKRARLYLGGVQSIVEYEQRRDLMLLRDGFERLLNGDYGFVGHVNACRVQIGENCTCGFTGLLELRADV